MWSVTPELMCRKHLIAEHCELHMFVGAIRKGTSIKGFLDKGLVDISKIQARHDLLVREMAGRGYQHCSPMTFLWREEYFGQDIGMIPAYQSYCTLFSRCAECKGKFYAIDGISVQGFYARDQKDLLYRVMHQMKFWGVHE